MKIFPFRTEVEFEKLWFQKIFPTHLFGLNMFNQLKINNSSRETANSVIGSRFSFSILSLVSLSACRLWRNDMSGIAEDGPLHNALKSFSTTIVTDNWIKVNLFTYTNDDGTFSLPREKGYSFTVKTDENTIDTSTGEVLSGWVLTAPSGSFSYITNNDYDGGDGSRCCRSRGSSWSA